MKKQVYGNFLIRILWSPWANILWGCQNTEVYSFNNCWYQLQGNNPLPITL